MKLTQVCALDKIVVRRVFVCALRRGGSMYRVLIVEDEIIVREWLKKRVRWEDYGLTLCGEAANGQEALEIYERQKPDIILTDIRMPVMDGITMLKMIRKQDKRCRFLILTCLDEFQLVKQAMNLDVTNYILKLTSEPDEIERELARTVEHLKRFGGNTEVMAQKNHTPDQERQLGPEEARIEEPTKLGNQSGNHRLASALKYLELHYKENISLQQVAEYVGVTPNYLGKIFLQCRSCTFTDEVNRLRIEEAKRLLKDPACRVYEVAELIGYANTTYFFRVFKKYEGCTPTEYRMRGGSE